MILRRISEGIRKQDWFVVAVEILTVVAGIFIGLQVDDWNERRKDGNDEIIYLERIVADLEISLLENTQLSEFQQRNGDMGISLLNALEKCELAEAERDSFASAIYLLAKTAPRPFAKTTIDELLSTGRMTIIRNIDLRRHIVRMLENHTNHLAYMNDVQFRMAPHVNYVDSVAPVLIPGPIGGAQDVSWDMLHADFQTLCADRQFYNSFASALNYNWDVTRSLIDWGTLLQELKDSVLFELERLENRTR
jgi:Family of unknown function (DUF6090)